MREWRAREGSQQLQQVELQGFQQQQQQRQHRRQQDRKGGGGAAQTRYFPRKYHGRPPLSPSGSWQQKVPSWEKQFCTQVCLIPWKKLCETKRLMSMYKNVARWDDSAGEEAFRNAKSRFWAKINGLPCDIPLPDPEMYIDVVSQDTFVDPQLVEDLYKQPPVVDDGNKNENCSWDSFLFADIPVPATGWGDMEDPVPCGLTDIVPTGWGDTEDPVPRGLTKIVPTGWGDMEDPVPCGWTNIVPTVWDNVEDTPTGDITNEPYSLTSDNNAVIGNVLNALNTDVRHNNSFVVDESENTINKNDNGHFMDAWYKKGPGKESLQKTLDS